MQPEPEPEPSVDWPADSDVAELVRLRRAARLDGDFRAADTIRAGLAVLGVYLVDTTVEENTCRVIETRHAASVDGVSWIRTHRSASGCKFWRHKSRSFCNKPVVGLNGSFSAADVWAALQGARPNSTTDSSGGLAEWLDISRLHYCTTCSTRHGLTHRCPCPFDPRHSILFTKLSGHLRLCQSKPGVSAAAAAGESGAAVPRGSAANAAQAGVNALCDADTEAYEGTVLVPPDADADAITAATHDLALLTALAERMADAISALTCCSISSDPPPVRSARAVLYLAESLLT
jgi:hypothetical protein